MKAILILSFLLVVSLSVYAQPVTAQNDSPCNQGRSDPDPRNQQATCFSIISNVQVSTSCEYGRNIYAVGDVNRDSLADWIIGQVRCDTLITIGKYHRYPEEILLYKGVRGGLPDVNSGQRIGPTEIGASTKFLASGDWDDDGNVDIACAISLYGDTTGGNHGFNSAYIVCFWGDSTGFFSINDTSHLLSTPEMDLWIGANAAASIDMDHDGVMDLFLVGGGSIKEGTPLATPGAYLFRGHPHERWGQRQISRQADWSYWDGPSLRSLAVLDQDGDGAMDIVLYANSFGGGTGYVSVLYGNPNGSLPDTATNFETADLHLPNGLYSLLQDVTGDGIPELLVHTGVTDERVKIYLGIKGQRLNEQFGGGDDKPPIDATRWWGRPWAEVWLPNRVRPNWLQADPVLLDFGDGNLDGIGDIWAYSHPYLLCYSGGQYLDSLVDGLLNTSPAAEPGATARLGDIDGSGTPTLAFGTGGGIIYFKASRDVPFKGRRRSLPDGTAAAGVDEFLPPHAQPKLSILSNNHSNSPVFFKEQAR